MSRAPRSLNFFVFCKVLKSRFIPPPCSNGATTTPPQSHTIRLITKNGLNLQLKLIMCLTLG